MVNLSDSLPAPPAPMDCGGCDLLGLTTDNGRPTFSAAPNAASPAWLNGGPPKATTTEDPRSTAAAATTAPDGTAQQPAQTTTTEEPSNGQLMSILQTLLQNQQQDSTTMRDNMRTIHDRIDATDNRLDHHEKVMQRLDGNINQLQEQQTTNATATTDPAAAQAFAALQARLDALEARQRQQGPTTTIPVLGESGGTRGEFTMVIGKLPSRHTGRRGAASGAEARGSLAKWAAVGACAFALLCGCIDGTGGGGHDVSATSVPHPRALRPHEYNLCCVPGAGVRTTRHPGGQGALPTRGEFWKRPHPLVHAGPRKTREERVRNRKLTTAASTIQAGLEPDEPGRR